MLTHQYTLVNWSTQVKEVVEEEAVITRESIDREAEEAVITLESVR